MSNEAAPTCVKCGHEGDTLLGICQTTEGCFGGKEWRVCLCCCVFPAAPTAADAQVDLPDWVTPEHWHAQDHLPDDEKVAEIRERRAKISSTPWKAYHRVSPRGAHKQWHIGNEEGLCQITMGGRERDYDFISHAPADIDYLLSVLSAAREPVAERERIWRLAYSTACAGSASDYCLKLIQQLAEDEGVTIVNLRGPQENQEEGKQ